MNNLTPSIEINPKQSPVGTVIWLHGLGADGNDFVPIVSELKLPTTLPIRFVFPHAPMIPVTINNGYVMRAWYDIVSMSVDQHGDQKGIDHSVEQLCELIKKEVDSGVPTDKIILAGFSQGSVIALSAGLTFPEKLGGILALSGYLPNPDKLNEIAHPANQATSIFLGHGKQDGVVPYRLGETVYQYLNKYKYNVRFHSYNMAHSVCEQEVRDISKWLIEVFGSKSGS